MNRLLLAMIRAYQRGFSGMFARRCRYYPTCSEYAALALRQRGPLVGSALAIWRLLRCNPWSGGGVDYPGYPRGVAP